MNHSPEIIAALDVARALIGRGVPLFLARPDPSARTGYALPPRWEQATPDQAVVDAWRPGWALCAVTGHALDLVDVDPRSGGDAPEMTGTGLMPEAYLVATTPSGGEHYFVAPLNVPSRDGVLPGVDLKSGTDAGQGRGFAFIAPTVRVSKTTGRPTPYRWTWMHEGWRAHGLRPGDDSGAGLRNRVLQLRAATSPAGAPRRIPRSLARREFDQAYTGLVERLKHWQVHGWGGEAHAGLLAATTHLARLSPDHVEAAFFSAFGEAGVIPDPNDMAKLYSAQRNAVPDIVVPDTEMSPVEIFLAGGDAPPTVPPETGRGVQVIPEHPSDPKAFDFVGADRARRREPPPPARWGSFGGTVPLVYDNGVHWFQGESESGKTWVALAVAVEILKAGIPVIVVDYEDHESSILDRMDALGATDDDYERLVYVPGLDVEFVDIVAHLREARDDPARQYGCLVVDGVTAALNAAGVQSMNNNQEVTAWSDKLLRSTRMSICIDHVVKAVDDRNGMAIGAQAKKSVVTATSIEVVCKEKFGRGINGVIELRIQKDKRGYVRGALRGKLSLRFVSDPASGRVELAVPQAVSDPQEAQRGLEAIDTRGAEVMAHVAALEAFPGARAELSARHLLTLLRDDMGRAGRTDDLRDAVRVFKARAGIGGVLVPEWFELYQSRAAPVAQVVDLFGPVGSRAPMLGGQDRGAPHA